MTQKELHLLGVIEPPENYPNGFIKKIESHDEAILQCIKQSRVSWKGAQNELARRLGIPKDKLSRFLNKFKEPEKRGKTAEFPPEKINLLMYLCGNYIPKQYSDMQDAELRKTIVGEEKRTSDRRTA